MSSSSTFDWLTPPPEVLQACRHAFEAVRHVAVAPVRGGKVVAALGGRVSDTSFYPIPDEVTAWAETLPLPLLQEVASRAFREWLNGAGIVSGIVTDNANRDLPQQELKALDAARSDLRARMDELLDLSESPEGNLVGEVISTFAQIEADLHAELAAAQEGRVANDPIAARLARMTRGLEPELLAQLGLALAALLEWDIDPAGPAERVEAGLEKLGLNEEDED